MTESSEPRGQPDSTPAGMPITQPSRSSSKSGLFKPREIALLVGISALLVYRLLSVQLVATLFYNVVSYNLNFDSNITRTINFHGEVEDGIFSHKFIQLTITSSGEKVNMTYHVVECGSPNAEPIVFIHGLAETWKVWKEIMLPFCKSYRPIAFDIEGQGQSLWPNILDDLPKSNARGFMGDMQLTLINTLGVDRFNLVVTDYGFWTSLGLLTTVNKKKNQRVLRYGKFQSTVGVEDPARIGQAKLFKIMPGFMEMLFNSNPYALPRVLMGRPLIKLPALLSNARTGPKGVSDEVFNTIILPGVAPNMYSSWVYFYHFGKDLADQMSLQLNAFKQAKFPVFMLQGDSDKGQPNYLFDGTANIKFVEAPIATFMDKRLRTNGTHKMVCERSVNGSIIGPLPESFFPNSPWVKFRFLNGIGHFLHLEAPEEVKLALTELLAVKVAKS